MKEYKLGEICSFIGGGTPSKSIVHYWDGDIPWASVKDLKEKYISETEFSISFDGVKNSSTNIANKDDLILCTRISPGKCAITLKETAINQDLKIVRPINQNLYINEYLFYHFILLEKEIISLSSGSTVKGITLEKIKELPVKLPIIDEQKKVVDILDKAQALINKRKQAIAKLDELVQSVFWDMFGDPVSNNKTWSEAKIGDLSTLVSSGSTPLGGSQAYKENGIPFIRSQNILMNKLMLDDIVYIDEETHNRMKRTWVKHNDVLLNITGASIGRVAVYEGVSDFANVNQHVCIIRLKDSLLLPRFCEYMISHPNYQRYIMSFNAGGTREAFNFQQIKKFKVICPPIAIQEKFLTVINAINKNRETNLIQLQHLESNFQALLQKAFKGELKVKDGVMADERFATV